MAEGGRNAQRLGSLRLTSSPTRKQAETRRALKNQRLTPSQAVLAVDALDGYVKEGSVHLELPAWRAAARNLTPQGGDPRRPLKVSCLSGVTTVDQVFEVS